MRGVGCGILVLLRSIVLLFFFHFLQYLNLCFLWDFYHGKRGGGLQCTCIGVIFCLKHYTKHLLDVNSLNVGKHTNYSYQTVTLLATYKN